MNDSNRGGSENQSRPEGWQAPIPAYVILRNSDNDVDYSFVHFRGVIKHKWIVASITITVAIITAAAVFLLQPTYRAEVLMMPVEHKQDDSSLMGFAKQFGGIASIAGFGQDGNSSKQEAIATLRSRLFTQQFMQEENLLPVLFEERWNADRGEWDTSQGKAAPTLWEAYELFNRDIRRISEDGKTGLVSLSIEWRDRNAAVKWANLLVERVNQHLRTKAIDEANKSLSYLNKELTKTSIVEIQQAIYKLIEIQINKIMLANVREEYSFEIIDPAVPPDEDDYVGPEHWMLIIIGCVIGLFLGVFIAFLIDVLENHKHQRI